MTEEEYNALDAVRRSALWEMRKSPAHYLYKVTHPEEPTPALLFGVAAHMAVLEPERFQAEYIVAPKIDRRTKEGKEAWTALMKSGKALLSKDDSDKIEAMRAELHRSADKYLIGEHEVPVEWADPTTGERCKCRPDCIGDGVIVDYKTTDSCADYTFERAARNYGYQLQAAMYTEGWFQTHMEDMEFVFVAQEKNPPYAVRIYHCDKGWIDEGKQLYRDLMDKFHRCKTEDRWPGYEEVTIYGN